MARYCQEETPEFVALLDEWLARLALLFRERLGPDYVATVLMGGYGRGWGSMMPTEGGYLPVNDFDVALVTRRRLSTADVLGLQEEGTRLLLPDSDYSMTSFSQISFHVDVMNFTEKDLPVLTPSQYHYDFVHGSRVVDGRDVLAECAPLVPGDLGVDDALTLILNHVINLYEPLAAGPPGSNETTRPLFFTSTKSAIAAGAAVTIVTGGYSSYPDERLEVLRHLVKREPTGQLPEISGAFLETVTDCTALRSCATPDRLRRTAELAGRAAASLCEALRFVLASSFGAGVSGGVDDLAEAILRYWRPGSRGHLRNRANLAEIKRIARSVLRLARMRSNLRERWRRLNVYAGGLCLMGALTLEPDWRTNVDAPLLDRSRWYLREGGWPVENGRRDFAGWQSTMQTAVTALKNQNLIR